MLIEFYYSDTCRDCHQLRRLLMENIPKHHHKIQNIQIKEINISYPEGMERAREINVMSVPTIVIDKDVVFVGRITKDELLKEINLRINGGKNE